MIRNIYILLLLSLSYSQTPGCMDDGYQQWSPNFGTPACNYNPDATVDDGSCRYPDEHYDCYGNCLVELDCAGNCCVIGEEDCYWQETGPCGEEGPSDGMDECGVCGGDNTSCMTCAGVPCSDAYEDNCGICDDIPENDCVQDCAGTWGGNLVYDECGICGGLGSTSDCGCSDIQTGFCDCEGNELDECGICDGDNSTCSDCAGVPNGNNILDNCGTCDDDPTNDCVQDCAGIWGGDLEWDCAGICGGDNSSYDGCCGLPPNDDCTDDCYIDFLGACCIEEDADECGLCFGDGTTCCQDGETNNDDPCRPMVCMDGNWYVWIIEECAEQEGVPCEGGIYVPQEEGECCSICVLFGDVNCDGELNVLDIVSLVSIIMDDGEYTEYGDVNGDGYLNILDVVTLVNWVLYGDAGACIDIDGNVYETVQIGEQLWMAENLKVTHYNNGDEISYPSSENFGSYDGGQYGVYDNDSTNADVYGNLYNWAVMDGSRGICPEGFHVPSDEEFMELEMFLGMSEEEANSEGWRGADEGSKLAENSDLWLDGNLEQNPEFGISGFNALPAGYRGTSFGNYANMGNTGSFWSSSESSSDAVWCRGLSYDYLGVVRYANDKQVGFSIRCLGD